MEGLVDLADAVVHRANRRPVGARHGREVFHGFGAVVGELLAPFEQRAVDAVPGVEAVFDPRGLSREVEGGIGIGDLHLVEAVRILRLGHVKAVGRFVAQDQQEGFFARALEPVQRQLGDGMGVIAGPGFPLAVDVELGAVIFALAFMGGPVIEAGALFVVVPRPCAICRCKRFRSRRRAGAWESWGLRRGTR